MIYRIRVREDAPGCYFDWRGWWFLHPMDGLTDRMLDAALYTDTVQFLNPQTLTK